MFISRVTCYNCFQQTLILDSGVVCCPKCGDTSITVTVEEVPDSYNLNQLKNGE
ncbi:MAG: hypothetical protein A4E27_00644 [Methanobacterium sp. PtaU1.Bin242]|jgi:Zn finger protein HypA/HybF involved in hydrogenase expression|nr:MAG: hypothetical protein A4E27_00644 [Methanobacterium sp. PtaU1.Bin242]